MSSFFKDGRSSFYCILRCLIPKADTARQSYGLQMPTLGRVYIKALQLSAQCKLLEWLEEAVFGSRLGITAFLLRQILHFSYEII